MIGGAPRLWRCPCGVLNPLKTACRRCGRPVRAPEATSSAPTPVPRALRTTREDAFAARASRGLAREGWSGPVLLLASAIVLATGWDPIARELDAAQASHADRAMSERARKDELRRTARELGALLAELRASAPSGAAPAALPRDWRARFDALLRRAQVRGDDASPLTATEVRLHVVALELASLHHRYVAGSLAVDALARFDAAERDLTRTSEDLAHAP